MPKQETRALTDDVVAILSVVNKKNNYRFFEKDTLTQQNLDDVCRQIFDYDLANEFYGSLVNLIGLIIFNHRRWGNPLKLLKHGKLERGEFIEEVFIGLIKAIDDTIEQGVKDVFDINKPEVSTAFYRINWKKKYPVPVNYTELQSAFMSAQALIDFVQTTIGRLYDSYNIDEYLNTKNILEEWGRRNNYKLIQVPNPDTKDNLEEIVIEIKAVINEAKFPRSDNNPAQVTNWVDNADPLDVVIFINGRLDASLSVKVLAAAFNMDEVTFMKSGIKVVVDDFGTMENVVAIVASRDAFKVFDRDISISDMWNGSNRTRNVWLHVWQVYAASPFEPAYALVTEMGTPETVTVTAPDGPYAVGNTYLFTKSVTGTGMFNSQVGWSVTGETLGDNTYIDSSGALHLGTGASGTITVTATTISANAEGSPVAGTAEITV